MLRQPADRDDVVPWEFMLLCPAEDGPEVVATRPQRVIDKGAAGDIGDGVQFDVVIVIINADTNRFSPVVTSR